MDDQRSVVKIMSSRDKEMVIEGEPGQRFAVYRFLMGQPYEREAEYDTVEEVHNHHWRLDRDQRVRLEHGNYLTRPEFEEWAKKQGRT